MFNKILYSLITIITFSYSDLSAQSVNQLDTKYGFKSFKLGTAPNKLNSNKIDSWDKNSNITKYKYSANDMDELFTVSVNRVIPTYYKNKLMSILIDFNDTFSESDYDIVLYSLKNLFGSGNNCVIDNSDYTNYIGRKWVGKKVEMDFFKLYTNENNKWGGYISITEKALQKQRINNEF